MKIQPILAAVTASLALVIITLITSCATGPSSSTIDNTAPAGLRSGDSATTSNSIDSILNNPQKTKRPGLGTGWGNEVNSQISYTNFTRKSSKPAGVASLYYNDKEGVAAMVDGWKRSGNGMQHAANGLVEWGVKGGWGSLKNYQANGRRYVVGRKNSNYSLVVKNRCLSRLEIVLSVDGLDVMDGATASFRKNGYIIQPGKTLTVKGFRTSESAVAAFKFSSVDSSYSNQRHGKTRNVGVIGMAVFTEKGVDPWKWTHLNVKRRHRASAFAEAPATRVR